jgi:ethanolamine ammonia-lyase large subunit
VRKVLGLRCAPEFEAWLQRMNITDAHNRLLSSLPGTGLLAHLIGEGEQHG